MTDVKIPRGVWEHGQDVVFALRWLCVFPLSCILPYWLPFRIDGAEIKLSGGSCAAPYKGIARDHYSST